MEMWQSAAAPASLERRDSERAPMTRVFICENDPVMRSALADLISSSPGFELVAAVGDPLAAAAVLGDLEFDSALLDVRMPNGGGPEVARLVRRRMPDARIVAFSAFADREMVVEMLVAGASEYLVKGPDGGRVTEALEGSGPGQLSLSPSELADVIFALVERVRRLEAAADNDT